MERRWRFSEASQAQAFFHTHSAAPTVRLSSGYLDDAKRKLQESPQTVKIYKPIFSGHLAGHLPGPHAASRIACIGVLIVLEVYPASASLSTVTQRIIMHRVN